MKWAVWAVVLIGCHQQTPGDTPADAAPDAPPVPAVIAVSPAAVDFGSVSLGYDSAPMTVFAFNTGGETSAALAVAIAPADTFQVMHSTCDGAQLAPQASCEIDVIAHPTTVGAKTAALTVGGAAVSLQAVAISEEGIAISPASHTFATTAIGDTSETQRFVITNLGVHPRGPLTVTPAGGTAQFTFAADTCTGTTLTGGQSCVFDVTFAPQSSGSAAATYTVSGGGTIAASVMGQAVSKSGPFLTATPTALDCMTLPLGTTDVKSVPLSNAGGATSGAITITGTGNADFTAMSQCTTLAPGASCTVAVAFSPTGTSPEQATFTIGATPGNGVQVVATGTGFSAPHLKITSGAIAFGSAPIGTATASHTMTVTNLGSVPTGAITVAKTGDPNNELVIGTDTCTGAMLNGGDTCHVDLTFAPQAPAGARSASISVSAAPGAFDSVQMTGDAVTDGTLLIPSPSSLDCTAPLAQVVAAGTGN
jgi:hypothetical protein